MEKKFLEEKFHESLFECASTIRKQGHFLFEISRACEDTSFVSILLDYAIRCYWLSDKIMSTHSELLPYVLNDNSDNQ